MLKRLRFKNWRSLRDVTIDDLGPITVLIGANSSGKSNIVNAIDFLRRMHQHTWSREVYFAEDINRILSINADEDELVEIEVTATFPGGNSELTYALSISSENDGKHFAEHLAYSDADYVLEAKDGTGSFTGIDGQRIKFHNPRNLPNLVLGFSDPSAPDFAKLIPRPGPLDLKIFLRDHLQILLEGFVPAPFYPSVASGKILDIENDASNTALLMDYLIKDAPEIFHQLLQDLHWLLPHVERIDAVSERNGIRLRLFEPFHGDLEAPTISVGTSRLMAILTAYYALDLRDPALPGMVIVEEPDTAIHPQLLKNFVELIRGYTDGEHSRQFIFTTHNPRFLDHFQPEEVRVVNRDEQGYTTVSKIPEHISEIWLDEYGLGEVWMTRALGDSD